MEVGQKALEAVEGSGGGQRFWRRSKAREAAQYEALDAAAPVWRRQLWEMFLLRWCATFFPDFVEVVYPVV